MNTKLLRFLPYEHRIDPSFWSVLYDKKLNNWRLDDSEKSCFIHIDENSVRLDRRSFDENDGVSDSPGVDNRNNNMKKGMIKVFNTSSELLEYYDREKKNLLKTSYFFVILVYVDLKAYSFDYFFALPTCFPSAPFKARTDGVINANFPPIVPGKILNVEMKQNDDCFILPWIVRNEIFNTFRAGQTKYQVISAAKKVPILLDIQCEKVYKVRYTGWTSPVVTSVSLSQTMDAHVIAEHNAELNLKLMMWKHEPELPLEKLRKVKCLLVGSGTVGCSVARNLIAWGVRKITFVDCANVSHSNPVRQNLYTTSDIGKEKASTAAENLQSILPSVKSDGHTLDIPMPGHAFSSTEEDFDKLVNLVKECDVIFLSTDSREGRWLPILLAKQYDKTVINIALGYETLLIQYISTDNGCYFCTDPVGPRDTVSSRTIDEKCTITRPGISSIASALAVELFVDIIKGKKDRHQIRFNLIDMQFSYQQSYKNDQCCCCSMEMVSLLADNGYRFIKEVKCDPKTIEDISGYNETEMQDVDIISINSEDENEPVPDSNIEEDDSFLEVERAISRLRIHSRE